MPEFIEQVVGHLLDQVMAKLPGLKKKNRGSRHELLLLCIELFDDDDV